LNGDYDRLEYISCTADLTQRGFNMLDKVRIVLLNTTHPGNIGATARAMKNMGLKRLYLVAPRHFPNPEAESRAANAADILDTAIVCETLGDAIADCRLVLGTSARDRSIPHQVLSPKECSDLVKQESVDTEVAILFGEERTGLTNELIDQCHYQVMIPTSNDYPSLNLSAAVQIISYELCIANQQNTTKNQSASSQSLATAGEMEFFYHQLEQVLIERQFINPDEPKRLMPKLRRFFNRARPEQDEINILCGMIRALSQ